MKLFFMSAEHGKFTLLFFLNEWIGLTEVRVLVEQGVVGKQRMLEGAIQTNFNLKHKKN